MMEEWLEALWKLVTVGCEGDAEPIITSYCRLGAADFNPPLPPLPPFVTMIGGVTAKMEPESKQITVFNKAHIGLLLIL